MGRILTDLPVVTVIDPTDKMLMRQGIVSKQVDFSKIQETLQETLIDRLNPATLAIAIADASLEIDDVLTVKHIKAGQSPPGGKWDVVTKGTTPDVDLPNGANIVASTGNTALALVLRVGCFVSLTQFGCEGGSVDNKVNMQIAFTYADTNRLPIIHEIETFDTSVGITLDDYINIKGLNIPDTISNQFHIRFTSGTTGSVLFNGSNISFALEGIKLSTSNNALQLHCFRVGILGDSGSQNASNQRSSIQKCTFEDFGGTCIQFGGEVFGVVAENLFLRNAQAISVNGGGELTFRENGFQTMVNSGFTAGAGNVDAYIYIQDTVTRWHDNIMAISEDFRPALQFQNSPTYLNGNKLEFPGRTAFTHPVIKIGDNAPVRMFVMDTNFITASSATGTLTASMIELDTPNLERFVSRSTVVTYGGAVETATPVIKLINPPKKVELSSNHREGSDNALIQYPDGTATAQTELLAGLSGTDIQFVTVTSKEFTILQNQTNKVVPFGGRDYAVFLDTSLMQILPVSMLVQGSTTIGGVVSFRYSKDTSNSDRVTLPSSNSDVVADYIKFDLRAQYISSPDQVAQFTAFIQYDSDASVSTSVLYTVQFTYAIIQDNPSRFDKFMVDIV